MTLKIKDKEFNSRLILGSGKFGSYQAMEEAFHSSNTELITVAMRRVDLKNKENKSIIDAIKSCGASILPNTSGVRNAKEAIFLAKMCQEALETNWLKLEIHPDPRYLLPDPIETLIATEELAKLGFIILPYINADPVLCKRLEEVGTAAVMPLAAPIGTNQGLQTKSMLKIIINQSNVPVIIDAGIGAPSQAAECMELGADAVLVNTAIAVAKNPKDMAMAFKWAVESGRLAFESGLGNVIIDKAKGTSPMDEFLNQLS
jgi:thiazole synthase